ncbi:hypothetical protein KAJ87_03595 [Candidatus Pacearchaeota archaeon]|nr:hypothetical protein [Candidatus Pacearchaeota archaeon]
MIEKSKFLKHVIYSEEGKITKRELIIDDSLDRQIITLCRYGGKILNKKHIYCGCGEIEEIVQFEHAPNSRGYMELNKKLTDAGLPNENS